MSISSKCAIQPLTEWPPPTESAAWIRAIEECGDLLESTAFQRLRNITFLGILAPRFRSLPDHPIFSCSHIKKTDGTRADHSVGVAYLFSELIRSITGNKKEIYALVWGLVHDIATWPLSHTSEPAFTSITGISSHELRRMIILGDRRLPEKFALNAQLKKLNIDPGALVELFDKKATVTRSHIPALPLIRDIARSPITPDSIEGMFRSGRVLGVSAPRPDKFNRVLREGDLFASCSNTKIRNRSNIIRFWEAKSQIYSQYINSPKAIQWESAWSKAIQRRYAGVSLSYTLELGEEEIISEVLKEGLRPETSVFRYKSPLKYFVARDHAEILRKFPFINDLDRVLIKEKNGYH